MATSPKQDASITYFPVGNGDTSLITLADGVTILIDLNFTSGCDDKEDPSRYDVRGHLLRELRKDDAGRSHLDAFILTHPDQDHLRGVDSVFHLDAQSKYGDTAKKAKLIMIDELWFAPRVFCEYHKELSDDAKHFKAEAERRMELHRSGKHAEADLPGNRIRIIGSSEHDDLAGFEKSTTIPGGTVSKINGKERTDFSFFVHAPFKAHTDDEDGDRNDTSVVLQARFKVEDDARAVLAIFAGDAACAVWERIIHLSEKANLEWDILLAPHHCSWTFFSDLPSANEAHVTQFLPASLDSIGTRDQFVRGSAGYPEALEKIEEATGGLLGYVGEWHTHPNSKPEPSSQDHQSLKKVQRALAPAGLPAVMVIVAHSDIKAYVWP